MPLQVAPKLRGRFSRKIVLGSLLILSIVVSTVFSVKLFKPGKALAAICESSYILDWSNPATYTVTCGSINSAGWSVKGQTCLYYSPEFNSGGIAGMPNKELDMTVRINQSGNLDGNDSAFVYVYINGILSNTYTCKGDSVSKVFTITQTFTIPCATNYSVAIKLQNDKTNELWQIKNNDVVFCLRSLTILPVTLTSFTGILTPAGKVLLKWTTASELNAKTFIIERSSDGKTFEEISSIPASGNSSSTLSYNYTDFSPLSSLNYYRLKQVDSDGRKQTFNTILVDGKQQKSNAPVVTIYPNPFRESFSIRYFSNVNQDVFVILTDVEGKEVYRNRFSAEDGMNSFLCQPGKRAKPGTYMVQVADVQQVISTNTIVCRN
jgi:hypothetical protein